MFFDDEPEDVKFLNVINRNPRRSSVQMEGRPILDFDPENETSFKIWKRKWESWIYMIRQEEGFLDMEKRFHLLMSCLSDATMSHVFDLGLSGSDERNPSKIIEGLAGLLSEGKNHHLYRFEFSSRVQQPTESLESWMASLKSLIKFTKFDYDCCSKCSDSRILQQLIFGVNSPEVRQLLLDIGPGLTLDQATRIIQRSEIERLALSVNSSENFRPTPSDPSSILDAGHHVAVVDLSGDQNGIQQILPQGTNLDHGHLKAGAANSNRVQTAPNAGAKNRPESRRIEVLSNHRGASKQIQDGGNKDSTVSPTPASDSPCDSATKKRKERSIKNWIEFINHSKSTQATSSSGTTGNRTSTVPPKGHKDPRRSRSADTSNEPKKPRNLSPASTQVQPDFSTPKSSRASFTTGLSRTFKNSPQTPKPQDHDSSVIQVDIRGMLLKKPEQKKASEVVSKTTNESSSSNPSDSKLRSRVAQIQNPGRNGSGHGMKRKADNDPSIEVVSASKRPQGSSGSPLTKGGLEPGTNSGAGGKTPNRSNLVVDSILKIVSRKRRQDGPVNTKKSKAKDTGKPGSESKNQDAPKEVSEPVEELQLEDSSSKDKPDNSQANREASPRTSVPEISMSLFIKSDPGSLPCQICDKTFESFIARREHQCSSIQPESGEIGYCSICDARMLAKSLDGNGKCKQCHELAQSLALDSSGSDVSSFENTSGDKSSLSNRASNTSGREVRVDDLAAPAEINKATNPTSNSASSESNLEQLVLEAISFHRMKNRGSCSKLISEKIQSTHPDLSKEAILAQIDSLCRSGKIKTFTRRNKTTYRLSNSFENLLPK